MYSPVELDQVRVPWAAGLSKKRIATEVGVSRATVREWLEEVPQWVKSSRPGSKSHCPACDLRRRAQLFADPYAYLLGQYLGDGYIVKMARTYRLRVFCCHTYPGIVNEVTEAMSYVRGRLASVNAPRHGVIEVGSYSNHWPCLFPQHGPGRKHTRRIRLWLWQREIVERHPEAFIRGLIHSDGCRFINPIKRGDRRYEYVRYEFSNTSQDIHGICRWALDLLGIDWRPAGSRHTYVSRRHSVAALETFVGPKH